MRRCLSTLLALIPALAVGQERTLVPVVAWGAPGAAGNRWHTEVYLSNLNDHAVDVVLAATLPLRVVAGPVPCLPPVRPFRVEGLRTLVVVASELNLWLGCPQEYVGGLVFEHPPGVLVGTRMTNTKGFDGDLAPRFLKGFSQEIPGVPFHRLPGKDGPFLIPSLTRNPAACPGGNEYDTYLYFANPQSNDVTVRLASPPGTAFSFRLGESVVELPYTVKVPAGRVVQLALAPPTSGTVPCAAAEFFDLLFEADGQIGVLASVVDRASNDARTVLVTTDYRVTRP